MARAVLRHILLGCAASGILAGCVDGSGAGSGGSEASAGLLAAPARSGAARDVEAPEIYQTTDTALWDGRPSLGGIWVAATDVKDPERVIMVNPATGKSVTGALFRREAGNPGPKLQLSSDAAEALGVLAGQPVQLRVTALRKVEAPAPAAPAAAAPTAEPAAEPAAAEAPAGTAGKAAPKGTAAVAAAALEASNGNPPVADETGTAATDPSAVPEAPKRKTWAERRAEARAKREAEKAAKAAAAAEAAPPEAVGAAAAGIGVSAVETAPLDARTPEAAAAPEPQKKTRRQIKAEEEAAAAAVAAAAAPAAAPAAPAGRPIQVASFSQEDNARRAVEALAKIGVSAQPVRSERSGKAVWGVVAVGDGELLKKIKGAGFADAYFLQ